MVFAFFLALTVYSYRQGNRERDYFAGLVLIMVASFNALMRRVFFPNSSPDPAQIGGVFRLVNGLFAVVGGDPLGTRVAQAAETTAVVKLDLSDNRDFDVYPPYSCAKI